MRVWLMLLAVLTLGLMPARALASGQDVSATHAYIQANYALAQAGVARIGAGQARIGHLNAALARECPLAGSGSPENEAAQPVSHEVVTALWAIAYGTDAGPINAFIRSTKGLNWSNHRITAVARTYARSLHELATIPMPNLCTDVRAWTASAFQVVPAGARGPVERVEAIKPNPIPSRLLAPFEQGADARTMALTLKLETRLEENEFAVGWEDWEKLLGTLGLQL